MIDPDPIDRCQQLLARSFINLRAEASKEQTQVIAKLIIHSMSGAWRSFHTPTHIFELARDGDSIEVLAALFHDTVYVQVDEGIPDSILQYISPYIYEDLQLIYIVNNLELFEDPCFRLCLVIFGYQLGQALPSMGGQNEFLSALFAAKVLEHILPTQALAQVLACIEATIPFRSHERGGLTCSEQLFVRLQEINILFNFSWPVQDVGLMVKRSVRLSNRDVENFSSESPALFLELTWSLIPELNHQLKNLEIYSTKYYVLALQRMESFMSLLSHDLIFKRYDDEPSEMKFNEMLRKAQKNLEIARLYLGVKLIPLALKEAFSLPDSSLLKCLDRFLPIETNYDFPNESIELTVFDLLKRGSGFDSNFDPSNSLIARYIIAVADLEQVRPLISMTKSFLIGDISAEDFLNALPGDIYSTMSEAFVLSS